MREKGAGGAELSVDERSTVGAFPRRRRAFVPSRGPRAEHVTERHFQLGYLRAQSQV